ncbi:response regulator [Christensenellaceae bacterium OttesenSCG-928-L17]|nr:response regulator [Christensenellaceae bacterium OttesenSCG-928-L17]
MKDAFSRMFTSIAQFFVKMGIGMRAKLILIFLLVKVLPIVLLTIIVWQQVDRGGELMQSIAVDDASQALNDSAVENIERMTTDTANKVADFLYGRDADLLTLAALEPTEENYRAFAQNKTGRLVTTGTWELSADGTSWVRVESLPETCEECASSNEENNDMDGFHHRHREVFEYADVPLYDEITFVGLDGREQIKIVTASTKTNYPMNATLQDVSLRENTYIKAETYFEQLQNMRPGEIYVSDVIGVYTPANYIGMYTPNNVEAAAKDRGYDIEFAPEEQAYAGLENPNGQRFEGIVRWATPVQNEAGETIGYVTFALNHDHIMEFVDHQTPMNDRYTELPSAYDGNYAFIWDYQCRSICHPRHNSIVGYDPETGIQQTPWLESSIYDAWQESGVENWQEFVTQENWPLFDNQSRQKKPAPALTKAGLVGLDGRYLNNAPQCIGWMDLTAQGGSGSFYILWSGLYKLTTAAAIPYYTGQYAPSENNDFSRRGFGIVTIGAGLEDFTQPAVTMAEKLTAAVDNINTTISTQMFTTTGFFILLVVIIAVLLANWLTGSITKLIKGISRFRTGERQFRFNAVVKDEFGTLADSFDDMADSIEDSVKNPLSIIDMDHKIIYMNQAGLAFNKLTLEEAVGRSYDEHSVYPPNSKYSPITALEEGREAEILYDTASQRYLKGTANYFTNKEGQQLGYIVETVDVTELSEIQLDLENAMKEAALASEHKGEFLARMSHEIRTPMNAIIGVTGIIQKRLEGYKTDDPKQQEVVDYVNQIESSSQHLLSLLNDILDLSKIEAGKIELAMEPVDLSHLADTVNGIIRTRCDEKQITYRTHVADFGGKVFLSDALRLRQVLINLLGNAVKFTPEHGEITFEISKLDEREDEFLIRFSVKDNGVGISRDAMKTIFEPFEQENKKVSKQFGGTGLGLSISKNIVELLGGELHVESVQGEGSEFSFAVWMYQTDDTVAEKLLISDVTGKFAGKRMLLVDDVDINRLVVKALLEDTSIAIDEATDGVEALGLFGTSEPGSYDIILMDIQMPNMDGYEATTAIRKLNRPDAKTVPIIALTANAFKEDIDKAMQHKMNAHISKPVELEALIDVLLRFIGEGNEDFVPDTLS